MKTAVLYLRVSTSARSRPTTTRRASRSRRSALACTRKAEQMGVTIVGEYVEPGRSATTMDKRPVFQAHARTAASTSATPTTSSSTTSAA